MSFLGGPPDQAKKPFADVLPDGRKRLTRYFQVTTTGEVPPGLDLAPGTADAWTSAPTGWTGLLLTYKKFEDEMAQKGADTRPILQLIYEQISATAETPVGNPTVVENQYGYLEVTYEWVQFSSNAFVPQNVGTTTAAAPWAVCVLRDESAPDDGTLRHIKRTYVEGGQLSDVSELRFGGKLTIRTIRSLNEIPATPSGYTLVGPGVEYINGLPVYSYQFAAASNGSGGGTGGQISQGFTNNQGGDTAFNPASPNSATGEVICTTRYVTTPAITSNPVTQPTGFVLFAVDVQDEAGFRMWETKSGFGGGDEITVDVVGQSDGALMYSVSQNDDDGTTIPAYPGSGTAYNVKLTHTRDNGFFRNIAIWHKPPATQTLNKKINFTKPGSASISGSPIQLVFTSPVTMDILAEVEVSYDVAQISDTPFTVESYAVYYENYTPVDTGVTVANTRALGGYLGGASGTSGTGVFNGIDCSAWEYQLGSSTPSSFSLDLKVLDVDNDLYLTDVSGTVVYRRTKVSYDFS